MNKQEYETALAEKKKELARIEADIEAIRKEYALTALRDSEYEVGQHVEYRGKTYEIVGASIFVNPCPDGRLVLKNGNLGADVKQLYAIQLKTK